MGVSQALKAHNPAIKVYVVEPVASAVISGKVPGYHKIQGIGEGFIPDLLDRHWFDGIIQVSDEDALTMACRLAREEGILAGISAGANVWAAIEVAKHLNKGVRVVTLVPDTGLKYLSTELFRPNSETCINHCASEDCKQKKGMVI
jgi:cysteine synthase A